MNVSQNLWKFESILTKQSHLSSESMPMLVLALNKFAEASPLDALITDFLDFNWIYLISLPAKVVLRKWDLTLPHK